VAAVIVTLLGFLGAFLGSGSIAGNDATSSRLSFSQASGSIAASLVLDIQHEQDLVAIMGAYFVAFPNSDQADFSKWLTSLKILKLYPDLFGAAELVIVPRSQLESFEANSEKASGLARGSFRVEPAGSRPYYCLSRVTVSRPGSAPRPVGLDYCDTELGSLFTKARDSGQGVYLPLGNGDTQELVVGTAIYKSDSVPPTEAGRLSEFIGWTGLGLNPHVLLTTVLASHPRMSIVFQFRDGGVATTFRAGATRTGATSRTVNLHNGWTVKTYGFVNSSSIYLNGNALALLLIGLALSLLIGFTLYTLGTGRSKALALVMERTADLEKMSLHDPLTGLANRVLLLDRIGQIAAHSKRNHTSLTVFFIDLDNFKDINDTLGHGVGDRLLVEVGRRLTNSLRESDTIGRLGGDEFIVLSEEGGEAGSTALAERMLESMRAPFVVSGYDGELNISASIGISQGVRDKPEDFIRDADIAMYQAKHSGKNCAVAFLPSMQEDVVTKRALQVDLERAIGNNEFFLVYQPIISMSSGRMTGVEALLRWEHPERGVVMPDEFIPELETSGLIIPVGLWVLREACCQGALWAGSGNSLHMSVNLSVRQLEYSGIIDDVRMVLAFSGLSPELLTLEITETALMLDVPSSIKKLTLLRGLGVRVAIDDFGTGYSSIAYLQKLPVDVVKIDRSFIANVTDGDGAGAVVLTLLQLGKDLNLITLAEGVETGAQRAKLVEEGADLAQGFFFSEGVHPDVISKHLETGAAW
jgi:diguanylate cyclase (GGDEF)-like protein